jgi:hypothetical protein
VSRLPRGRVRAFEHRVPGLGRRLRSLRELHGELGRLPGRREERGGVPGFGGGLRPGRELRRCERRLPGGCEEHGGVPALRRRL